MIVQTLVFVNAFSFGASLQSSSNQATVASHANPWDPRAELLRYQHKRKPEVQQRLGASSDLSNEFLIVDSPEMLHYNSEITSANDLFSASWMMNLSLFMRVDVTDIRTVEDGCFAPFRQANSWGYPVGQTRDWFDFSVEHLSHYWRAAGVCSDSRSAHDIFMGHMNNYISNVKMVEPSPLQNTIGILAFQPYFCTCPRRPGDTPGQCTGEEFTKIVLTATLKSLMRAGLGRVVVVSTVDTRNYEPRTESFGNTRVVFIKVDPETTKSEFIQNNLPRGAIANLQEAVRKKDEKWLGKDPGRWRSVLLTEPDMIMHIKENSIHDLAQAVENGFTISPHRLQPVPHPSDTEALENPMSKNVESVDSPDAKCIDVDGDFRTNHPGFVDMCTENPEIEGCCSTWWWQCGFTNGGNHTRIDQYTMMRLGSGSGVTVLSADEHARKCTLYK